MISFLPADLRGKRLQLLFGFALFVFSFLNTELVHAQSPGGVHSNLQLWLKADTETYSDRSRNLKGSTPATLGQTVAYWGDQSGAHTNDATDAGATLTEPKLDLTNPMNYNPVLDFAGKVGYTLEVDYLYSTNQGMAIIAVVQSNTTVNSVPFLYNFGFHGNADHYITFSKSAVGFRDPFDSGGGSGLTNSTLTTTNIDFQATHKLYVNGIERGIEANTLTKITAAEIGKLTTRLWSTGPGTLWIQSKTANDESRYFEGKLAEIIVYDQDLDATGTAREKTESYLALKCGITLDQSTASYYLDSQGTVILNASANSGDGPILATTSNFTTNNQDASRTSLGNGNFMILAHNNGTENSFTSSFDSGTNNRSDRVWRVDEIETVGNVRFALPLNAIKDIPSGRQPALVISNDTPFDGSDTIVTLTYHQSEAIYHAKMNPQDGDYIAVIYGNYSAGYTVSETALTIDKNVDTGTFTVILETEPTNDVAFDITTSATGEAMVLTILG